MKKNRAATWGLAIALIIGGLSMLIGGRFWFGVSLVLIGLSVVLMVRHDSH